VHTVVAWPPNSPRPGSGAVYSLTLGPFWARPRRRHDRLCNRAARSHASSLDFGALWRAIAIVVILGVGTANAMKFRTLTAITVAATLAAAPAADARGGGGGFGFHPGFVAMIATAVALACLLASARADSMSGDDLRAQCGADESIGFCTGFLAAIIGAEESPHCAYGLHTCFPANASVVQGLDVVKRFLDQHPGLRRYEAGSLAAAALAEAFPCRALPHASVGSVAAQRFLPAPALQ
jgi:hypothetical protein